MVTTDQPKLVSLKYVNVGDELLNWNQNSWMDSNLLVTTIFIDYQVAWQFTIEVEINPLVTELKSMRTIFIPLKTWHTWPIGNI